MPQFDTSTPTLSRKFSDVPVTVPAVFAEGHALTSNEAKFLNSTLATVVGNGFSGEIRKAMEAYNATALKAWTEAGNKAKDYVKSTDPTVLAWDFQSKFNEKFTAYELGVSNRGSGAGATSNDPLEAMITTLATADLKARIVKKGLKVSTFYKAKAADGETSKWAELLAANIEAKREAFTAQAQSVLDNLAATDDAEDSLLDGVDLPAEVPAAA